MGLCYGHFTCTDGKIGPCDAPDATNETCNGKDDDCDGDTDENLGDGPLCDLTNAYGTCPGKAACVGGKELCQGSYPAPEVCNGIDDDCDGDTEEGSGDVDKEIGRAHV